VIAHLPWLLDEFLLERGWSIRDPGPGLDRLAVRGRMTLELGPACRCEYCPPHEHPNYIHTRAA